MRKGDVLEWLAGIAFVVAAYLGLGLWAAFVVLGIVLFYLAQCYSDSPLKLRLPHRSRPEPLPVEVHE